MAKAKGKGAPKKSDPAALAMLLQMLMAQQPQAQGAPGLPAWRAGRPPTISPAGSPPLL